MCNGYNLGWRNPYKKRHHQRKPQPFEDPSLFGHSMRVTQGFLGETLWGSLGGHLGTKNILNISWKPNALEAALLLSFLSSSLGKTLAHTFQLSSCDIVTTIKNQEPMDISLQTKEQLLTWSTVDGKHVGFLSMRVSSSLEGMVTNMLRGDTTSITTYCLFHLTIAITMVKINQGIKLVKNWEIVHQVWLEWFCGGACLSARD